LWFVLVSRLTFDLPYDLSRRPDGRFGRDPRRMIEDIVPAMMTDPIADMLTRIRNAGRIEKPVVDMPTSRIRRGVAQALKDEGFIWDYEEIDTVPARTLRVVLKYGPNGERVINRIDRVSKPGRRLYQGYKTLRPVLAGMGIFILSTPKGVMSDRQAKAAKVGGEVLAIVS
jgi:small subunit ribosomal protein S8